MMTRQETPSSVDLDETAELPMLPDIVGAAAAPDSLAVTDAWVAMPPGTRPDAAPEAAAPIAVAPVAAAEERPVERDHLERREAEIGALRSDLASAAENRGELEGNLHKLTTNLRELEQLLNRKSEQLSVYEREVGLRDRRIAALESQLPQLNAQLAQLTSDHAATVTRRDALNNELAQTREEYSALTSRLQLMKASAGEWVTERSAHSTRVQSLEGAHARRVAVLEGDAAQARANAARYHEQLQTLESRRVVFESMLGDRESLVSQREARIAALEREISQRSKMSSAREEDLLTLTQVEQKRVQELEAALTALRAEQQLQQNAALFASKQAQDHSVLLTGELSAQAQTIGELRAQLAQVRESLDQRNALIARLEAAAASSAAVLGNIQENLTHMGTQEPTRMLVRTEGETGIVQLLGKRTTIGRTPDNDIRIDADFISRHHAVVLVNGASTILEDLNSTNGSFVNGARISRRALMEGDLVTLGKSEFRFVVKQPTERPS